MVIIFPKNIKLLRQLSNKQKWKVIEDVIYDELLRN